MFCSYSQSDFTVNPGPTIKNTYEVRCWQFRVSVLVVGDVILQVREEINEGDGVTDGRRDDGLHFDLILDWLGRDQSRFFE